MNNIDKNWLDAIKRVLLESGTPMHYTDISDKILSDGYKTTSATPSNSVNSIIASSIKDEDDLSPFVRIEKGVYALKQTAQADQADQTVNPIASKTVEDPEEEKSKLIIHSFGIYWERNRVNWQKDPSLLGKQPYATTPVDFGKQIGIYILYDNHDVVYVGRTSDGSLGKRLLDHTKDRVASRWNRFSWFGLLSVTPEGKLCKTNFNMSHPSLAGQLEALLIEVLEPPQNRRRGDGFKKDIEYIQDRDPKLEDKNLQKTFHSIQEKLRGVS
jgi:hypothetical protein